MDQPTQRLDRDDGDAARGLDEHAEEESDETRVCPRCQGEMLRVNVAVPGRSGIVIVKRPGVWTGVRSGGASGLGGFSCSSCGFTELYALEPGGLMFRE